MPTYEYACRQCGEHLEVVQAFTDDALTTCSICGGDLKKVFGNIGIVFKGKGFYKTDSRSGSSASTSVDAPSTSDKSESNSDAKPDAKADAKSDTSKESTVKSDSKSDKKSDSAPAPTSPASSSSLPKAAAS
jgi:putative FmdB family regulatory protein